MMNNNRVHDILPVNADSILNVADLSNHVPVTIPSPLTENWIAPPVAPKTIEKFFPNWCKRQRQKSCILLTFLNEKNETKSALKKDLPLEL
jgi:hypothetical protein